MTCKYTLLLCLLFATFCIAASDKTCSGLGGPDSKPQQLKKPAACCWYEESSCCTSSDISEIITSNRQLTAFYDQKTNSSNDVPSGFDKCFTYVESMLCIPCAPDTATFYTIDTEANNSTTIRVHLCQDWCDDFYASCQEPFAALLASLGVTNGTSLCLSFHLSDLNVTTITPSTTTKVKTPSSTPSPSVTTKKAKTLTATPTLVPENPQTSEDTTDESTEYVSVDSLPVEEPEEPEEPEDPYTPGDANVQTKKQADAPNFEFVVSTSACYEGPSPDVIGRSGCTPWKAENYESSGGFWWYWILILIGVLGICIILAVAVAVVAFFVYKRRTAANVTVKEGDDYPNLEELE